MMSCDAANDTDLDFYHEAYRVGLWVNSETSDTLVFADNSNLSRRGSFYRENYVYKIDQRNLHIKLPGSEVETQHPILASEGNRVKLGNMYITVGQADNSGTFYKVE